jgi:hypothetical protein
MVNELLDLTRIEAGAIRIDARPIETSVVVAACVATVRPLASQNDVRLDVDLASGGVVVADPVRLRQVLLNLLSNAIKYNRPGGSAHMRCEADGEHVRITVTDTGLGIDAESFGELFTPFTRLETSYSGIEGAGIGLALSKRLVEAMDGRIGATSVLGEGSTFWIELPRADPDSSQDLTGDGAKTANWTVLCVEDNPSNLRLLERIIGERDEFEMLQTQRGETCLRLATVHRPDVILLDLGLPGIDGYEVLRRLRAEPATASIPVIAISANAMRSEIERAEREGFDDYVTKPFTAENLVDTIHHHLPEPTTGTDR